MKKKSKLFFILVTLLLSINYSCAKRTCSDPEKEDCICTTEVSPVCGSDNVTYSNACEAECKGISKYKTGECN